MKQFEDRSGPNHVFADSLPGYCSMASEDGGRTEVLGWRKKLPVKQGLHFGIRVLNPCPNRLFKAPDFLLNAEPFDQGCRSGNCALGDVAHESDRTWT